MNKGEWVELLRNDVPAFDAAHREWQAANPDEKLDLSRADLTGADLSEADLYGAKLYGANLSRANLTGANLSRANLTGANLYGAKSIWRIEGIDERGYALIAVAWEDGPRFGAGCHWFTLDEALAHWGSDNYPDKARGQRYVAGVKLLAGFAKGGDV